TVHAGPARARPGSACGGARWRASLTPWERGLPARPGGNRPPRKDLCRSSPRIPDGLEAPAPRPRLAPPESRVPGVGRPEVGRARARPELGQQGVVAVARLELTHPAVRVVDVPEDDRIGWADGLAGGHDLAVADRAVLLLGGDARPGDPLDAVRALLHHAA